MIIIDKIEKKENHYDMKIIVAGDHLTELKRLAGKSTKSIDEILTELLEQIIDDKNSLQELWNKLSFREREIATSINDGNAYKQVAVKYGLSPETIKAHARNIYKKLDVSGRHELLNKFYYFDMR